MKHFERELTVRTEDLDHLHHVNNVRYVQWVQDIAEDHWNTRTPQDILDTYFWVLLKHTIEYKNEAVLDDKLSVKTYIKSNTGATCIRVVEIHNKETEKLIAYSETLWCLISQKSKRPSRITAEIEALFT